MILTSSLIAFIIPDMPRKLKEQAGQEAYLTNEVILRTELEIAQKRHQTSQEVMREIRYLAPPMLNKGNETSYV